MIGHFASKKYAQQLRIGFFFCLNTALKYKISQNDNHASQSDHVKNYRQILHQIKRGDLKKQLFSLKKISKKYANNISKTQMIQQLCKLPEQIIIQEINKYQNKSNAQLKKVSQNHHISSEVSDTNQLKPNQNKKHNRNKKQNHQKTLVNKQKTTQNDLHQNPNSFNLKENLTFLLNQKLFSLLKRQKWANQRIMNSLYGDYVQKNRQKMLVKSDKMSQSTVIMLGEQKQILTLNNSPQQKQQKKSSINMSRMNIDKLYKKPMVNKLFKTEEQFLVQEKKIKYFYENQKPLILQQLLSQQTSQNIKQVRKYFTQLKYEKNSNLISKGFPIDKRMHNPKYIVRNAQKSMHFFSGFHYYKHLIQDDYLIQFIYAITYDKKIPIQYTIMKIRQKYMQSPILLQQTLNVISQQMYLIFLRTSANYLQKLFKISKDSNLQIFNSIKSMNQQNNIKLQQQQSDDEYSEDQDGYSQKKQLNTSNKDSYGNSSSIYNQPHSKQEIVDFNLMKFSYCIIEVGLKRMIKSLNQTLEDDTKLQEYHKFDSQQQHLENYQSQNGLKSENESLKEKLKRQKQKDRAHKNQIITLCFDIFKTLESQFLNVQINNLNDLQNFFSVLSIYNQFRKYLKNQIKIIESFMKKIDAKYQQKVQLGLSSILTQRQLSIENFVLKLQGRKLNFDINDNINAVIKQDNAEITLQNKRQKILNTLEAFLKVYVQNDMIELIEQELIYNTVRFLQKQVYLNKKIIDLYSNRINFKSQRSKQFENINQQKQKKSTYKSSLSNKFYQEEQEEQIIPKQQQSFNIKNLLKEEGIQVDDSLFDSNINKHKEKYYEGHIKQFLSRQLLYYLVTVIRHKHKRNQIKIEQINPYSLIQQWYSEPSSIRLQFLRDQIITKINVQQIV